MFKWHYIIVVISTLLCCDGYSADKWDYLVFTQTWPVTKCIEYRTDPNQKCIIPENVLEWTIHGLWPNKFDGTYPSYCNKSVEFDPAKIRDIRTRLQEFWPNLLADKTADSLWKHEWEKHGTCALDFQPLNNEKKYFQKGLDLYALYNMTSLLPRLKIFPEKNKEYSVIYIINTIRNALSKDPYLECIKMDDTGLHTYYLSEIRLCFSKNMQLIDCIPTHFESDTPTLTNCPAHSTILYPKNTNFKASVNHIKNGN